MLGFGRKRVWAANAMKSSYDAVIIGGGLHGLATAYFLAKTYGMRDVAVVEKNFIGFGGAGRNTAIVRANQRTGFNVPLYKQALDLWPVLTRELDFNLMFNNCGNLNLPHSEAAVRAARMNVATARFYGVESHLLDAKQTKALEPALNISEDITYPIQGAFSHVPCRIVTLAREADGSGVLLISCARGYARDMVQALLSAGAAFGLCCAGEARFVCRLASIPSENPSTIDPPGHERRP